MKKADQQIQSNLQRAMRMASGFSARTVLIIRLVIVSLLFIWVAGGMYLHHQVKQDEQRIEQNRIEQSRRDEFLRRGAQYKQRLNEFNTGSRSRNVFDER